MVDSVFECDLFFEPEALSRFVVSDDKVDFSSVVRFGTDGLSPSDLSKLVAALREVAVVNQSDSGVDAKVRVAFLKSEGGSGE